MRLQRRRHRLGLAVSALAAAAVATGCSPSGELEVSRSRPTVTVEPGDSGSTSPSPSPSVSVSSAPSTSAAPTPSPTPVEQVSQEPSPTASQSPAAQQAPAEVSVVAPEASAPMRARLLTAEELPGFDEDFIWTTATTRTSEGRKPFGTCHKFAMTSIGAMRVTMRDYLPPAGTEEGVGGSNLVAEFPDQRTARRAFEVLQSWRGQCEEELQEYERRSIGGFDTVQVDGAEGGWYLLIYGPVEGGSPDDGYFDAQGFVRVGKRISVLQMRGIGQDYNYDTGQEPLVEGVRTSAAKLG